MKDEVKTIEVKQEGSVAEALNEAHPETEKIRERRVYLPRTDIYETPDSLVLVMDVPGSDESSVEITLDKNVLTVHAYPTFVRPENHSLAYAEYGEGDYQRSFALSEEIDREKIVADVKHGVLTLHLAKVGATQPHKIAVRAG
jgi:HSP20 family molecular chaperone IbpA